MLENMRTSAAQNGKDSADINAPRVNPFVTVVAGTVMTVSEEVYSADGRIYLKPGRFTSCFG